MLAFVGPCPDGMEVCHNDGNPENNRVENLRYGTRSDNMRDKRKHGTCYNSNKTRCKQGHPLSGENVYVPPNQPTWRQCRACFRAWAAIRRRKAAAKGLDPA